MDWNLHSLQTTPLLRCSVLAGDSRILGEVMWLVEARPGVEVPRQSQCSPSLLGKVVAPRRSGTNESSHCSSTSKCPDRRPQVLHNQWLLLGPGLWPSQFLNLGIQLLGAKSESHLGRLGEYCHFAPAATETIPSHVAH